MIAFIVGTMVGGMYGVFIMCLLQISRDDRWGEEQVFSLDSLSRGSH